MSPEFQLASLFTGFVLGFGFLTVWEAIKQTKRNMNRWRSQYIMMVWGEIFANIVIIIMGWLIIAGIMKPTVGTLVAILSMWVLELQLLMQIIVNRIALIAEDRKTVLMIKWGTAFFMTLICISVFVIWIPSHITPPVPAFVRINHVWDKIEKVCVLCIDAFLNYYFLITVRKRLVKQHGLKKYQPLVSFNAKLMVVSVSMDVALIGMMFMKDQLVYILFHPIVYMVKLNIEMSMASLIVRLAHGKGRRGQDLEFHSIAYGGFTADPSFVRRVDPTSSANSKPKGSLSLNGLARVNSEDSLQGIECRTEVNVMVEKALPARGQASLRSSNEGAPVVVPDEYPLRQTGQTGLCNAV